ncbi:MAG: YicC/YloC family endoribonuclease [Polyangia bacterium]
MTGYGRSSADIEGGRSAVRLAVEIRSVNHRGFDLKLRSDEPDAYCDAEITRLLRASVERGSVSVTVRNDRPAGAALDLTRIKATYQSLDRMRRESGISTPVDLATVAAFMSGTKATENPIHGEEMWTRLRPAVEAAIAELLATRAREGTALGLDMGARAAHFATIVDTVAAGVGAAPARFARRLEERLAALRDAPGFDQGRVAQEIALMAERLDVSEELLRLKTHLEHFRALLEAPGAVGRKLDFVIQEMGREINTVGSKAQDATVAAQVIDGKAELEKIREQAQNIE